MKKMIFLAIILVFLIAGCTSIQNRVTGLNILDYEINNLNLIVNVGKILHFDFTLENIGNDDARDVTCRLEDAPGFSIETIKCNSIETGDNVCFFGDIEPNEVASMDMTLRAPNAGRETDIFALCQYGFTGQNSINFKIYDINAQKEEGKREVSSKEGPLQIIPDVSLNTKEIRNGKTVSSNEWIRENKDFTLKVNFKDMGSSGRKWIGKDDFKNFVITLEDVHVNQMLNDCNFTYSGNKLMLPNVEKIDFNDELTCELTTKEVTSENEWKLGQIIVDYDYTYKFEINQTIEVT